MARRVITGNAVAAHPAGKECRAGGVLVLQTGHHWHAEDATGERYAEMAHNVLDYVAAYGAVSSPVVYATSFRGLHHFEGCGLHGAPLSRKAALAPRNASTHGDESRFAWLLPERNDKHWAAEAALIPAPHDRFFVLKTSVLNTTASSC